jgi:hypothetical protein
MKIETLEKYIKVTAEEGFYISDYKEGDDILNFSSFKEMYAPLYTDLSNLREITEEENNIYNQLQEIKLRELENGNFS